MTKTGWLYYKSKFFYHRVKDYWYTLSLFTTAWQFNFLHWIWYYEETIIEQTNFLGLRCKIAFLRWTRHVDFDTISNFWIWIWINNTIHFQPNFKISGEVCIYKLFNLKTAIYRHFQTEISYYIKISSEK